MTKEKLLFSSAYVGDAYFLETKEKSHIEEFAKRLRDNSPNLPEGTHITIEYNYYPDWAADVDEDEDDE